MTSARRQLIDANATPFYHVINRCVRMAFLCGEDKLTGHSYEHRRGWVVDKIKALSAIFCIDICAYAVMSNHYHLVLKIDLDKAKSLTQKDIINRWCQITKGHAVATKYMNGDALIDGEVMLLDALLAEWHERLSSISWFMRCLNEEIARKANHEDEQALLACMVYVDLNPIRAGIADSLQSSDFASIQERVNALNPHINSPQLVKTTADNLQPILSKALAKFDGSTLLSQQTGIPFHFADYLELIDWTGRAMRLDEKGYIDN